MNKMIRDCYMEFIDQVFAKRPIKLAGKWVWRHIDPELNPGDFSFRPDKFEVDEFVARYMIVK